MGHLTALLADMRKRPPRDPRPFDRFSKVELWERLQAAEKTLSAASRAAQCAATSAHNYAQGATGEQRRQFLAVRDAAYKARDAAQSATQLTGEGDGR